MSKSQYEKRKEKQMSKALDDLVEQVDVAGEAIYTQTGYDVYTSDSGKSFHVAEIEYNPTTGVARVIGISDLSRMVALKYANQKVALGILKTGGRGK